MILLELYRLCGFWGIGSLFTLNITEIAKFEIGRLRPHFIAACNITLTEALCFEPLTQTNVTDVIDGSGDSGGNNEENFVQKYTQIYKVARSFCTNLGSQPSGVWVLKDLSSMGSELQGIWSQKKIQSYLKTGGLTEALCFEPNPLFNLTDSLLADEAESMTESREQETFVQKPYTQIYKVAKSFCNRDLNH